MTGNILKGGPTERRMSHKIGGFDTVIQRGGAIETSGRRGCLDETNLLSQ